MSNEIMREKPFVMIDGHNLDLEKGTGVATYARNLSFALKSLNHKIGILHGRPIPERLKIPLLKEIRFFDSHANPHISWPNLKAFKETFTTPFGGKASRVELEGTVILDSHRSRMAAFDSLWNSNDLFGRAHRNFTKWKSFYSVASSAKAEIMHWTYPLPLRLKNALNIYTLHDLVPLRLPYTTLDNKRRYLNLMRKIVCTADHIVTVSENSRKDIINLLGVPESRVTNTYQSVSIPELYIRRTEKSIREELSGAFQLEFGQYFLFYGAIEPKKNVGRLIEAHLASGLKTPLIIVGGPAWLADRELQLFRSLEKRIKHRIQIVDYVPFSLLVSLIRGAKATLFPSIYEGFGLPVLESMQLGTPVLSSLVSSIPEITGDAALLVNPYDPQAISEGIRALDSNADLRATLSKRGRIRAEQFSSERYAERIDVLYQYLLRKKLKA